ncbi:MAG: hypothetical protein GX868_15485 [Actinobacteria bacterium]|nr:hypothetical protein [Actinomycetota bacterium]
MDISDTIAPKSDQLNADDLIAGTRTVTVDKVTPGTPEQPVEIHLLEFPGRPFKPSKTVRRILVAAWGPEASAYTGRRMTLYRDATVRFGGSEVGGIRVSALSHIDKRLTLALTTTRGKRAPFVIEPLVEVAPTTTGQIAEFEARIGQAVSVEELDAIARDLKAIDLGAHGKTLRAAWSARKTVIEAFPVGEDAALDDAMEAEADGE